MIEPEPNQNKLIERLRLCLPRLWMKSRGIVQFTAGISAALLALVFYNTLNPEPEPLTEGEVRATVFQVMASATPPPAYSTQVYQIIQPSLVLIQTQFEGKHGENDDGLGSAVGDSAAGFDEVLMRRH